MLGGVASMADYQTILESLSYGLEVGREPPCPLERRVQVAVYGQG